GARQARRRSDLSACDQRAARHAARRVDAGHRAGDALPGADDSGGQRRRTGDGLVRRHADDGAHVGDVERAAVGDEEARGEAARPEPGKPLEEVVPLALTSWVPTAVPALPVASTSPTLTLLIAAGAPETRRPTAPVVARMPPMKLLLLPPRPASFGVTRTAPL